MPYKIPFKILFYTVLVTLNMSAIDMSFGWIREADTFLNIAGLVVLVQLAVLDFILINLFTNKIK